MYIARKGRFAGREALPAVLTALALASGLALALGVGRSLAPMICGGDQGAVQVAPLALLVAPWGLALGWLLMLAAMTPPLLIAPLRHLWDRSFSDRRATMIGLFGVGYLGVWMAAAVPLVLAAQILKETPAPPLFAAGLGLAWQVSPAKQAALNRCHRRPPLAAFGLAAARDALRYGAGYGFWCCGACWPVMLLPLVLNHNQLLAMAAAALFLVAERFDPPSPLDWRWRGPTRVVRLVAAKVRVVIG